MLASILFWFYAKNRLWLHMQFHKWQPFGTLHFILFVQISSQLWFVYSCFAGFKSGNRQFQSWKFFCPCEVQAKSTHWESGCEVNKSFAFYFGNLNKCWRQQFFSYLVLLQWPHSTGNRRQQLKDDKPSVLSFISFCSLLLPHQCTYTVAHTHTDLSTHHWASHFLFLSPMFPLRVLWQLSSSRTSLRVAHLFFCMAGYWCLNRRQGHRVFVKMVPRGYTDKTKDGETKSQH